MGISKKYTYGDKGSNFNFQKRLLQMYADCCGITSGGGPIPPTLYCAYGGGFATDDTPFQLDMGPYGLCIGLTATDLATYIQTNIDPLGGAGYFSAGISFWFVDVANPGDFSVVFPFNPGLDGPVSISEYGCEFQLVCRTVDVTVSDTTTASPYTVGSTYGTTEYLPTTVYSDAGIDAALNPVFKALFGQQANIAFTNVTPTSVTITAYNILDIVIGTLFASTSLDPGVVIDPPYNLINCP